MEVCDDSSRDLKEVLDLTLQNSAILGSQNANDFSITYYDNEDSAQKKENILEEGYSAPDGQTIFARVENNNTGCFSITSFQVIVYPFPNEVPTITLCDTDYDGVVIFDLTVNEDIVLNGPSDNFQISYFENLELIDDDSQALNNPSLYSNQSNPQTIYVKIFNISANCYNVINQELNVELPPNAISI